MLHIPRVLVVQGAIHPATRPLRCVSTVSGEPLVSLLSLNLSSVRAQPGINKDWTDPSAAGICRDLKGFLFFLLHLPCPGLDPVLSLKLKLKPFCLSSRSRDSRRLSSSPSNSSFIRISNQPSWKCPLAPPWPAPAPLAAP